MVTDLRYQLVIWNSRFPLDRDYRKRHNIAFGSEQHRKINQIDIYFEWLEDQMYNEHLQVAKKRIEDEKQFEKGVWLKESVIDEKEADAAFAKLDVSKIPSSSQIQVEE